MVCPKCFKDDIKAIGDSHYMCNNPECAEREGKNIQFNIILDGKVRFPYNQIFIDRKKSEFYREPYLQLASVSNINNG